MSLARSVNRATVAAVAPRQRAGLIVISVVLLSVGVIAGHRTHLVAGSAQAAPVPQPPTVGDCVVDPIPVGVVLTTGSGGTVPSYPAQQVQPCTGLRYGDVAAVIPSPAPTVATPGSAGSTSLTDPNMDSCLPSAQRFLGIGTATPAFGYWFPSLGTALSLAGPSARQRAAGQHWAACVVAPSFTDGSGVPTSRRYGSSIHHALHTGVLRDQLGNCASSLDWLGGRVGDCARPHLLEQLAYGTSGARPVDRSQVASTCRQMVGRLTGMPDLTAGGALVVLIYAQDDKLTAINSAQIPPNANLACGIASTGTQILGGSLIALGRQPVPWAPR